MGILNRMNEEQQKRLDDQRGVLKKRNEDASELDKRIEELTHRLRQKKLLAGVGPVGGGLKNSTPSTRMHTIVAAVEPLVKKPEPNVSFICFLNANNISVSLTLSINCSFRSFNRRFCEIISLKIIDFKRFSAPTHNR